MAAMAAAATHLRDVEPDTVTLEGVEELGRSHALLNLLIPTLADASRAHLQDQAAVHLRHLQHRVEAAVGERDHALRRARDLEGIARLPGKTNECRVSPHILMSSCLQS